MARVVARLVGVAAVIGAGFFLQPASARADFTIEFFDLVLVTPPPGQPPTGPFASIAAAQSLSSPVGFIFSPTVTVGAFTINTIIGRSFDLPVPFLGISYSAGQIFTSNTNHVLAIMATNTSLNAPGNSTATLTFQNRVAGNVIVGGGAANFFYQGFADSGNASPGAFTPPTMLGNFPSFDTNIGTLAGNSPSYALNGALVNMVRSGDYSMGTVFFLQVTTAGSQVQINNITEIVAFQNGPDVTVIPEPSSALLAVIGSALFVGFRRLRRTKEGTVAEAA